MNVREKLVELLNEIIDGGFKWHSYNYESGEQLNNDEIASHLIAHGVTVQEWIPVTERLPEEKVNYIIRYNHAYCDNDGYWAIGFCFYDGEKFQIDLSYKVTHWMPLPEPPKGE